LNATTASFRQQCQKQLESIAGVLAKHLAELPTHDGHTSYLSVPGIGMPQQLLSQTAEESAIKRAEADWSLLKREAKREQNSLNFGGLYDFASKALANAMLGADLPSTAERLSKAIGDAGFGNIETGLYRLRDECVERIEKARREISRRFNEAIEALNSQYEDLSAQSRDRDRLETERLAGFLRQTEIDLRRISNQAALTRAAKDKCMERWSRVEGYSAPNPQEVSHV
jgi:hypothetical protein